MFGTVETQSAVSEQTRIERAPMERAPEFFADSEPAAAWQIFNFNARVIASVAGGCIAILITTDFYIEPLAFMVAFAIAAIYWRFGVQNAKKSRWNPRVSCCLAAIAQMIMVLSVLTPFTYFATSIGLPLRDTSLLLYDRALGFDFRSYLDFTNHHRELLRILGPAYGSISWQMIAMAIVIPVAGFYRRTGEAICAYMLALLATTCISTLIPAIGVYDTLGLTASDFPYFEPQGYYDTLRDAPLLRAGNLHGLNLLRLVGVLTFPSFHAAAAVLYMWAFWPLRWIRPFVVFLNVAMIAATPLGGGHYLVDIIAGVAVATIAIMVALAVSNRVAPSRSNTSLPIARPRAELSFP